MSCNENCKNLRNNDETSKVGLKWSIEDDNSVKQSAISKMNIDDIAKLHKRTLSAVKSRILLHAVDYMKNEDKSIEDAALYFNVDIESITNYQYRMERKVTKVDNKLRIVTKDGTVLNKELSNNENTIQLLTEIRDLLMLIASK